MNFLFRTLIFLALISFVFGFLVNTVLAQAPSQPLPQEETKSDLDDIAGMKETLGKIGKILEFGTSPPSAPEVFAAVLRVFLGILGLIFIFLILYGGFHWMTAMGNEDRIKKAKETLVPAVIGVIIIIAAYAITDWVISKLIESIK